MNAQPGPNDLHHTALVGTPHPSGQAFEMSSEIPAHLLKLELAATHLIQAIRLTMQHQGNQQIIHVGHPNPPHWHEITHPQNLVGLSGSSGWYLDALQFHFRDGSHTKRFGGDRGDSDFQLSLAKRNGVWQGEVVGLWGYANPTGIESLGLIFWSVERQTIPAS
jgi:hypothetical protein